MANLDKESIRHILTDELNVKKKCLCSNGSKKFCQLSKKELKKEICSDLLQCTRNELDLLKSVIACDETWIFTYDLETKQESVYWKSPDSSKSKERLRESFEVIGHLVLPSISRVLDGTVGFQVARLD